MKAFLRMSLGAIALMAFPPSVVPEARAQAPDIEARLDALQKAVEELRADLQASHAKLERRLDKLAAGQQTMIRRGVVIAPQAADVPKSIGAQTNLVFGEAPSLGKPDAPIEVVEFAEFQCPHCIRNAGFLRELVERYPEEVRVGFKHYPIARHKMSTSAARAAWAAQQQGKFWEMHDALFADRGRIDEARIREHARAIGLDMEKFEKDYASNASTRAVFRDRRAGKAAGVRGTPTFYVNGQYYGNDAKAVRAAVEEAVARRASAPGAAP